MSVFNMLDSKSISSHGNVKNKTNKDKVDYCGRPAIADKGKRNANDRHESDNHTHINGNFQKKIKEDTDTKQTAEAILGLDDSGQNGKEKERKERHQSQTPHKAPFLAENSHGKV